jgi:hypothetical protein
MMLGVVSEEKREHLKDRTASTYCKGLAAGSTDPPQSVPPCRRIDLMKQVVKLETSQYRRRFGAESTQKETSLIQIPVLLSGTRPVQYDCKYGMRRLRWILGAEPRYCGCWQTATVYPTALRPEET